MQTNVLLPQLELTMEGVLVAKWLVDVGARIQADEPLIEVETQKAVTQVPAPTDGYLRKMYVSAGDAIGEKALLCILTDTVDEPFNDPAGSSVATVATKTLATSPQQVVEDHGGVRATPAARRLARGINIDLTTINGTGPNGRITECDVRQAQEASTGDAADDLGWTPLNSGRLALIEQMQRSLREIPQIHLSRQMDVTPLCTKIAAETFTHRLIVALSRALAQHAALRTVIVDHRVRVEPVSVAVAMNTKYGLLAPVLRAPDLRTLPEIVQELGDLRRKAESNALRRQELIDAPFALSNLGMFHVDSFSAFVFHGQTAVLSIGRISDGAEGSKVAWFGLAADHRVVDGVEGAQFLQTLQSEISAL